MGGGGGGDDLTNFNRTCLLYTIKSGTMLGGGDTWNSYSYFYKLNMLCLLGNAATVITKRGELLQIGALQ